MMVPRLPKGSGLPSELIEEEGPKLIFETENGQSYK